MRPDIHTILVAAALAAAGLAAAPLQVCRLLSNATTHHMNQHVASLPEPVVPAGYKKAGPAFSVRAKQCALWPPLNPSSLLPPADCSARQIYRKIKIVSRRQQKYWSRGRAAGRAAGILAAARCLGCGQTQAEEAQMDRERKMCSKAPTREG
jgi:hypothetical protein